MSILNKLMGIKSRPHKNRVTKSYRPGRRYRAQYIFTWEDNRPKIKTIIHQMY